MRLAFFLALAKVGRSIVGEDANNGDNYQQFDQSECLFGFHFSILLGLWLPNDC